MVLMFPLTRPQLPHCTDNKHAQGEAKNHKCDATVHPHQPPSQRMTAYISALATSVKALQPTPLTWSTVSSSSPSIFSLTFRSFSLALRSVDPRALRSFYSQHLFPWLQAHPKETCE
jgi:hypothetical protein